MVFGDRFIITAVLIVVISAVALIAMVTRGPPTPTLSTIPPHDGRSSVVFTDHSNNCRYVVVGTDDGLHIVINGAVYCRDLILIDGARIALQRRADR